MKLAYLVNRYPAVSHSFIRREILALEALGHEVVRFSIRPVDSALPDPSDAAEAKRTVFVLAAGAASLTPALGLACALIVAGAALAARR